MKSLKEVITESKLNFDFTDFWYSLLDYARDKGQYRASVGKDTLDMKDVFGVDTITCTSLDRWREPIYIQWIYPSYGSKKEIGAWSGSTRSGGKGFIYLSSTDELKRFFSEKDLKKLYDLICK